MHIGIGEGKSNSHGIVMEEGHYFRILGHEADRPLLFKLEHLGRSGLEKVNLPGNAHFSLMWENRLSITQKE